MTMVVPCRLMTRQRSHMGLTDGRTFMAFSTLSSEIPRTARPHATGDHRSRAAPAFVRIFGPSGGDRDRVLEVRGEDLVDRGDRPVVVVDVDLGAAGGDHRLDREGHPLARAAGPCRGARSSGSAGPRGRSARRRGRRGSGRPRSPPPRRRPARRARCRRAGCPSCACSIPAASASWQTSRSRCASAEISPTGSVTALSATRPSSVTPRSTEIRSPSFARYVARDAVDDHRVRRDAERGRKALVALRGRDAAVRGDVLVGEPVELEHRHAGLEVLARRAASVSWTSSPARAMPSISCADLRMIMRPRLHLLERLGDLVRRRRRSRARRGCRRRCRASTVVVDERRGLALVELEPAVDPLGRVVGAVLLGGALAAAARGALPRRDLEVEDDVEGAADLAQHGVERLGLRERCAGSRRARSRRRRRRRDRAARESARSSARPATRSPRVEERRDLLAERRSGGDRLAEQSPVATCGTPYASAIFFACVPFPDSLRPAEHDDVQLRRNPS